MNPVVVYTAIICGRDRLWRAPKMKGVDFICFSDSPNAPDGWEIRHATFVAADPQRACRYYKLWPYDVLPNYHTHIWMDGHVSPGDSFNKLVILAQDLPPDGIAAFPHRERDCIYQEAAVCLRTKREIPALIHSHVTQLRREGYPEHAGLHETGLLLRRNGVNVRAFSRLWLERCQKGPRRDQLTFDHIIREMRLTCINLTGVINANTYVKLNPHVRLPPIEIRQAIIDKLPVGHPDRTKLEYMTDCELLWRQKYYESHDH